MLPSPRLRRHVSALPDGPDWMDYIADLAYELAERLYL
jgi:hypothetical protein